MLLENVNYYLEIGIKQENQFKRNIFIPYNEDINTIRNENSNTGLHTSAFLYDNIDNIEESIKYGDFYIDFDSDDFNKVRLDVIRSIAIMKILFNITTKNIKLYYSGRKGVHLIIPAEIFGVEPHKQLPYIYKHIAIYISKLLDNHTIDTQVYHKRAMLRLEESIHDASGLFKTRLSFENLRDLDINEIRNVCKKHNIIHENINTEYIHKANITYKKFAQEALKDINKNNTQNDKIINFMPDCIKYLLDNGATIGYRNICTAVLSSYFKASGNTLENTLNILNKWNKNKCIPIIDNLELQNTVKSIFNGQKSKYGCATLKEISKCNSKCKFRRHK